MSVLRKPANAMLASADSLPGRVEESLAHSEALDARFAGLEGRLRKSLQEMLGWRRADEAGTDGRVDVNSLDAFTREGTGPYPEYVAEAERLGMDPNEYMDEHLGWSPIEPILDRTVVPFLRENSTVCELGPATGRWSRYFLPRLGTGTLHLVDYSPWFVQFLADYFQASPQVQVHQTDGFSLPLPDQSVDLLVSFGTFVMLKAGTILSYARDFRRVLRPGSHFALEYLDGTSAEGWGWLQIHSKPENATVFVYYTPQDMARLFTSEGLEIVRDEHIGEWYEQYPYRMLIGRRP